MGCRAAVVLELDDDVDLVIVARHCPSYQEFLSRVTRKIRGYEQDWDGLIGRLSKMPSIFEDAADTVASALTWPSLRDWMEFAVELERVLDEN